MPDDMPNRTKRTIKLAEKIEKNLEGTASSSAMERFHAIAKELGAIPWNHNEARRLTVLALVTLSAALKESENELRS